MDAIDLKIISGLRKGISLSPSPFDEIAAELAITPQEILLRLTRLKEEGVIRRFLS